MSIEQVRKVLENHYSRYPLTNKNAALEIHALYASERSEDDATLATVLHEWRRGNRSSEDATAAIFRAIDARVSKHAERESDGTPCGDCIGYSDVSQITCRAFGDGWTEAHDRWVTWYAANKSSYLHVYRAYGAWLKTEIDARVGAKAAREGGVHAPIVAALDTVCEGWDNRRFASDKPHTDADMAAEAIRALAEAKATAEMDAKRAADNLLAVQGLLHQAITASAQVAP